MSPVGEQAVTDPIRQSARALDRCSVRAVLEGTHAGTLSGPGGDIAATNRSLVGGGTEIIRVEDGKIALFHLYSTGSRS